MRSAAILVGTVFATYRIARFLTIDTFPPIVELRARLIRRWGDEWGEIATCPHCAGWWVSGLACALLHATRLLPVTVPEALLLWPAVAGAQSFLASKAAD